MRVARRILRGAYRFVGLPLVGAWCTLAIAFSWSWILALLFAAAWPLALRKRWRFTHRAFWAASVVVAVAWILIFPSNDRDWSPDQAVLPRVEISGDIVRLRNVRRCTYRDVRDYTVAHEDRSYDLKDLRSVDWVLETFSAWDGAAHSFLTFGFRDGRYVAVSVEIRKEKGEEFSALQGIFKRFEIMYVVGEERDLIGVRANHRKDDVFLYPVRATPEQVRRLFLDMAARINALAERPEFYNPLTNACTTNIVRHVDRVFPGRIPFSLSPVFPGYADRLALDIGLLDTDLPYEGIRPRFRINERAWEARDLEDFSSRIRRR